MSYSLHLSTTGALWLAQAITVAQDHAHVRWLDPQQGREMSGTVRGLRRTGLSDDYPSAGQDVRGTSIRITLDGGSEYWVDTLAVAGLMERGEFARDRD